MFSVGSRQLLARPALLTCSPDRSPVRTTVPRGQHKTFDLVIEATEKQLRAFVQVLSQDEYHVDLDAALEARKRQSVFNVVDMVTGWKIDLIIRKSRPFSKEEFSRRTLVKLQDNPLFLASAEDVVVSKPSGGVCEQRHATQRFLPQSGFKVRHARSASEETAVVVC